MALVTMKKVYIVGPDHSREMAVDKLQELGVLHVKEMAENPVDPPGELAAEVSKVERIIKKLKLAIKKSDQDIKQIHKGKGEELVEKYETIVNLKNSVEQEIAGLEKEEKQLLRWGDFERKDIELLAEKGVNIKFYHASAKEIKDKGKDFLEAAFWYKQIKLRGARDNGFIVAFKDEVPQIPFETPSLPDNSLSAIRSRLEKLRKKQEESQKKYLEICQFKDVIEEHLKELQTKYDRAKVLGGIRDEDPLFALMGFTPAKKVAKIEEEFGEDPVAVVVEDPDDDDEVPVKLHNPPIIRYFEPLIKLFNPPHYREFDPTVLVAPFLGVFFGFCLADAAYGLFLLIIGGVLAPKFKKNQTALYFMRLIQVLGFSTLVIGLMMGQFMGVQLFAHSWSQKFRSLMPLMVFSTDYNKFLLWALNFGVIQLMVGFIVKIFLAASRKNYQLILANLGWIGITISFYRIIRIWPNWSRPDFLWPAVACSVLIFFFNSPHRSPLKRMMGGFGALYNIVGVGGDMVSYARIFGLGLSSGIIASIVNTLAIDVFNTNPYFGWFFALLIFLFGHSFNFAMAVIGSLVHSARLNFLEYYDKFFEGGGKLYAPFKSRK